MDSNYQKNTIKRTTNPTKTYNKNNPGLFKEISNNPDQLKNDDKIKNISETTKIIKSKRQTKNLKHTLTSS